MERVKDAELVPPRSVKPDVPAEVDRICMRALARDVDDRYATAADMRTALLSVPFEADEDDDDITTAMFVRDVPAAPYDTGGRRQWAVPVALAVVVAVVLGTVAYLFWQSQTGKTLLSGSSQSKATAPGAPIAPVAHAFDPPPGDGHEHDSDLSKLTDRDPNTVWTTEHYDTGLAGIKQGVGFTLLLNSSQKLERLQIVSPTRGWSANVYVAASPKSQLAQWGSPVASHVVNGATTFDLHGRAGSAVLVWITDLGRNQSVAVGEATLTS